MTSFFFAQRDILATFVSSLVFSEKRYRTLSSVVDSRYFVTSSDYPYFLGIGDSYPDFSRDFPDFCHCLVVGRLSHWKLKVGVSLHE